MDVYITENPTIKILYLIPELTEAEEKMLHYYFDEYLFNGREWFTYEQEILDFFKELDSQDDLFKRIDFIKKSIKKAGKDYFSWMASKLKASSSSPVWNFVKDLRDKVPFVLAKVFSSEGIRSVNSNTVNSILLNAWESNVTDFTELLDYFKNEYGEDVVEDYERRLRTLESDQKSLEIVEKYYSSTTIIDRLKILCENEISDIVLSNIPDSDELKAYYKVLGPEKIKATYYNITLIRKEFNKRTFSNSDLSYSIFKEFNIGDKILLIDIKESLRKIYESVNYKGTPKATDLGEYFEIKELKISTIDENGKKKRSKGFELLSVKSKYQTIYDEVKEEGVN